ncbi:cytochrome c family protein [Ruegeria sp. HKCCD8929]|uniref:c-type cytochrome n=1 Tax=Ruegeria sp. HKCCD8929 TaxID=2683006 RepID=UPI001488652A|nr:cytochrome c family protein [Ruegeria sp. HKCCD8929]
MIKRSLILATLASALALPAVAEGDAEKGEKVFRKCKACHAVGEDAKNKVGPQLNGIIGAPAGQVEGFKYSSALIEAAEGGLVWDEASLTEFLAKPKDFMKGTKMSFAGLKKESDQADVIAYLSGF